MQLDPGTVALSAGAAEAATAYLSSLTIEDVAGGLFAVSLFPYLGFLYHLDKEETNAPPLGNFGFRFLLVFVFASIPAAIAAKALYGDILANVDWLHGSSETFLTLTNIFIVLGFRRAVASKEGYKDGSLTELLSSPLATLASLGLLLAGGGALAMHPEPANALSFPTWMVHISSLIEWLAAMGLVWRYADVSGNPRWKGLTWGMLPFHSSGLCAVTYHFFYNAKAVELLVAVQGGLTVVGDLTCWYATYRIYQWACENPGAQPPLAPSPAAPAAVPAAGGLDSEGKYLWSLFALVAGMSAAVKWGELAIDLPFEPSIGAALAIVGGLSALNVATWLQRSSSDSTDFNEFY